MNWTVAARTMIVCGILLVLHFTLRPLLAWRASADFLIIALVFAAVRVRPGLAAVFGLVLGLAVDSLGVSGFGANALGMSVVAFGASWLKAVFFADNFWLNAFFLFIGKWVFDLVVMIASRHTTGGEVVMHLLVWSPLQAAVTAAFGVLVLMLLRPLTELRTT